MNKVAIIQARMGSSRLPGKVLLDIAGKPMIQHVIKRTQRARTLDAVVVATTTDPADDPIAAFAVSLGIPYTRGSLHDVLDRYYQAAKSHQAEVVVRVTADCPVIDPEVIDFTVNEFLRLKMDFAANRLPPPFHRTFPIGLDVEVCTFAALQRAWNEADQTFHREHVMPFLYESVELTPFNQQVETGLSPRGFKIALVNHVTDYGEMRWTVDTPEDLVFIREIFARLKANLPKGSKPDFTWYDVLEIVKREPQLAQINAQIRHKTMTEVDERSKNGK
jgi:spore coat polysaccharide biosynthesis protein SpsF